MGIVVSHRALASKNIISLACVVSFGLFQPMMRAEVSRLDGANVLQVVQTVNEAASGREAGIAKMVSTRRYTLRNKRWQKDAVMHVRIVSEPGSAKRFEILALENAEGLQKKVFTKLLEAEVEASRSDSGEADSGITLANYDFTHMGREVINGRECLVLQLKPKRNSKYLLEGKAWIDPKERAILRVEGKTARSISFWIGKPHVVQEFRKVDDVWVAATNRSVSDVKFLGRTELQVEFVDYDIAPKSGRVLARNELPSKGF